MSLAPHRVSRMQRFQICLVLSAFLVLFSMEHEMMTGTTSGKAPEDVNFKDHKNKTSIRPRPSQPVTAPPPTKAPLAGSSPTIARTGPSAPVSTPTITKTTANPTKSTPTLPPVTVTTPNASPVAPPKPSFSSPPRPTANNNHIIASSNTNSSSAFLDQHCDLAPLKSWYPPDDSRWQQRAPYVIIAGVWNAGIRDVAHELSHAIGLLKTKNDGFFLPKQFYRTQNSKRKTKVFAARQRMYAQMYNTKLLKEEELASKKQLHYYMDVSPGYLFYPNTIYPILCTAPWTKFIVILRDPVDRLYRQWVYGKVHLKLTLSLEAWMAREMKVMQSVGLTNAAATTAATTTTQERNAWKDYQTIPASVSGAIGRSLYVLQLQEWFDALKMAGKDPKDVMYIVPSEALMGNAEEYSKLYDFLGLSTATNSEVTATANKQSSLSNKDLSRQNNIPPMKEETKQMLKEFFAPYNERLANLLGNDFGDYDWKNIWKD